MHRYEYDADNRLTHVFTSRDGLIWEKEAKYWYYKHGPLARTEIGDLDVQGMDYAYTLQGWVKGINSNILEAANDLGRDNMDDVSALKKNIHKNFGEDAASYSIGYFSGDYVAINSNYANFVAGIGSAGLDTEAPDLYNGNINHMVTTIRNNAYAAQPQLTAYRYDQLNRIKQMKVRNAISNNVWDGNWIDRYKTMYDYDANGNIMSLIRHGGLSPFVKIDDMKYQYNSNDNRLQYIDDPNNPTSEPNFSGQSAGNYQYDAIGNMIADESGKISEIKWNVYGKISQILKDHTEETATPLDDIEFRYDATGNRVAKIIKPAASLNNPQTWKYTFYVRDAQGNILATYTKDGSNEIKLGEYNLYGSSRLGTASYNTTMSNLSWQNSGIYSRTLGLKRYEISNHLGNVLTVFSDKKHTLSNTNRTTPYILSTTDYDPFGMIMNGRDWNPDRYRFGFNGQEKTDEIKGTGNHLDFKYRGYDPQTGRFWSVDPLFKDYPWNSTYCFAENDVIRAIDLEGAEKKINTYNIDFNGSKITTSLVTSKDVNNPFKLGNGTLNFYQGQQYNIRKGMESYAVATYQETNNLGQTSKFQYGYSKSVDDSWYHDPGFGTFYDKWRGCDPANEGAQIPENGSVALGVSGVGGYGIGISGSFAWDNKGGKALQFNWEQSGGWEAPGINLTFTEYTPIDSKNFSVQNLKDESINNSGGFFIYSYGEGKDYDRKNNIEGGTYKSKSFGINIGMDSAIPFSVKHSRSNTKQIEFNTTKK